MGKRETAETKPSLRAILFVFGSFVFAWCLALLVHESGHALARLMTGVGITRFCVNPLGQSFIWGDAPPENVLGINSLSGALIDLVLSGIVFLIVRRRCRPLAFPFALWLGIALYQEAGGAIVGLISGPQSMEDWGYLTRIGFPVFATAAFIVIFLALSFTFILAVMPTAGLSPNDGVIKNAGIFLAAILPYFIISAVYFAVKEAGPIQKKLIPLGGAVALAVGLSLLYQPLKKISERIRSCPEKTPAWPAVGAILAMAVGLVLAEYLIFVV